MSRKRSARHRLPPQNLPAVLLFTTMLLRVLIIDESSKAKIKCVVDHAMAHPITYKELVKMVEQNIPIGDKLPFACVLPVGVRCCFTIEEQLPPLGWCRHISISVSPEPGDKPKNYPNEHLVAELLPLFGFRRPFTKASDIYIEEDVRAVNIIEDDKELAPV